MKSNKVLWDVAMFMGHQWVWFTKRNNMEVIWWSLKRNSWSTHWILQTPTPCGADGSQMWWNSGHNWYPPTPTCLWWLLRSENHTTYTRWWFQRFFYFHPWGNDPIWRAYFQMGWSNHQLVYIPTRPIPRHPCAKYDAFFTPPFRSNFEAWQLAPGATKRSTEVLVLVGIFCASCISTWNPKQLIFNGWKCWNNNFSCKDLESSYWNDR